MAVTVQLHLGVQDRAGAQAGQATAPGHRGVHVKVTLAGIDERGGHVAAVSVLAGGGEPFVRVVGPWDRAPRSRRAGEHIVIAGPRSRRDVVGDHRCIVANEDRVADGALAAGRQEKAHAATAGHGGMSNPKGSALAHLQADGAALEHRALQAHALAAGKTGTPSQTEESAAFDPGGPAVLQPQAFSGAAEGQT